MNPRQWLSGVMSAFSGKGDDGPNPYAPPVESSAGPTKKGQSYWTGRPVESLEALPETRFVVDDIHPGGQKTSIVEFISQEPGDRKELDIIEAIARHHGVDQRGGANMSLGHFSWQLQASTKEDVEAVVRVLDDAQAAGMKVEPTLGGFEGAKNAMRGEAKTLPTARALRAQHRALTN